MNENKSLIRLSEGKETLKEINPPKNDPMRPDVNPDITKQPHPEGEPVKKAPDHIEDPNNPDPSKIV